ncbi:MAG: asparagine synthase (glutamine-hydrolyzing) [bacterium]|nr:asparagine synthase (glutamine-hydrolyzing) [bacterium]
MCGIVGAITKKSDLPIEAMLSCIAHRGPDDSGSMFFRSDDYGITLGQRRLSIIDLSPAGHQPMRTIDGRFWITYNGELYNFPEIKQELLALGYTFRSQTDTEVILNSYAQWGEAAIQKFNGMFAFALWDARYKKLILARDHAGQKPLYYANLPDSGIVFASEIKAILASGLIQPQVNTRAIPGYLGSLRVHAPDTMFEGIFKLEAAHTLVWQCGFTTIKRWWDPLRDAHPFTGSRSDAIDILDPLFRAAIKRHMIADVPVGAFLSGGLDSSMIVSEAAQNHCGTPLTTFTTGFSEADMASEGNGKNELTFARMLRDQLGNTLDYREIILQTNVAELLPKIIWHLDEPLCDPAAINAYLICQQAKAAGITVLLSGMGADEVFGGYNHHVTAWNMRHIDKFGGLGRSAITALLKAAQSLPKTPHLLPYLRYLERKGKFLTLPQDERTIGLMSWLMQNEVQSLLRTDISANSYLEKKFEHFNTHPEADLLNRILYTDCNTFLSEHNLMYTDKMSMASSCEVRSPFLDREIMEFAFSLPPEYKINGASSKDILKRLAVRSLPRALVYQRKSGFAAPIRAWKDTLQTLAKDHLDVTRSAMQYFNASGVRNLIEKHRTGESDVSYQLWSLITFALWHERFIEK